MLMVKQKSQEPVGRCRGGYTAHSSRNGVAVAREFGKLLARCAVPTTPNKGELRQR